jgi:rubredoxin
MAAPRSRSLDVDDGVPPLRRQFRCSGCGYGASRRIAPDRCPMCSGTVWEFAAVAAVGQTDWELDASAPLSRDR